MANERGVYGSQAPHKIGAGGVIGLAVGFGVILVALGASAKDDLRRGRELPTEADLRRARIAARAHVVRTRYQAPE